MAFDMGESFYEKPKAFKLWPKTGNFTALVDADLLPYIVGFTTEEAAYAKAVLRVEEGECSTLEETPEFDDAADHMDWLINYWVQGAGADSALLYITDSPLNFRLGVAFTKPYKGQRPDEKPPFFLYLRKHLIEKHQAIVATEEEADDLIVTELSRRNQELVEQGAELGSDTHKKFSDVIAVSSDKDLRISPGWHYDPQKQERVWVNVLGWLDPVYKTREVNDYEYRTLCKYHDEHHEYCMTYSGQAPCDPEVFKRGQRKGEVKTKRVKVGLRESQYVYKLRGAGLKFFYAQLLMGDDADNYPGCPRVGMTRAFDVLNECETEEELYHAVLQEYRKAYGTSYVAPNYRGGSLALTPEQMLIEQGRLAWMQTRKGELWRDEVYCPRGEEDVWRN